MGRIGRLDLGKLRGALKARPALDACIRVCLSYGNKHAPSGLASARLLMGYGAA